MKQVKKPITKKPIAKKQKEEQPFDILSKVLNPQKFPWKIKSKSIKEVSCVGVFEYIPGKLRGKFMDEISRILKDDGKASFIVPYWNSSLAIHDYMYEFPPVAEQSFLMFNKEWRIANKKKVDMISDWDFTYGYVEDAETTEKNDETKFFYIKHYSNAVQFVQVVLTKRISTK